MEKNFKEYLIEILKKRESNLEGLTPEERAKKEKLYNNHHRLFKEKEDELPEKTSEK